MSGIGEKIKDTLTGHHHDADKSKTSDASHTKTGEKHDPEIDAKKATSAAGNYPYWGDLPREGEGHQDGATTITHDNTHNHGRDTGLAAGALGTGAGAGSLASRDQNAQSNYDNTGSTQQSLPDRTTQTTQGQGDYNDNNKRDLAAGAGAGAGAAYLASKYNNKDDEKHLQDSNTTSGGAFASDPTHTGRSTLEDQSNYGNQSGRSFPLQDNKTAGVDDEQSRRRKEEELLAGGAGAAGLAGAGYYASKKHNEDKTRPDDRYTNTTNTTNTTTTTTNPTSTQRDPTKTSSTGLGDDKNDRRRDEELLAAGAGAAGLAGAGYYANKKHNNDDYNNNTSKYGREDPLATTTGSYPTQQTGQTGPTTSGGVHNTVVGAGSSEDPYTQKVPREAGAAPPLGSSTNATTVGPQTPTSGLTHQQQQQTVGSGYGAPKSGDDRDRQALYAAAGVGAGAGAVAAEEKYRHRKDDEKPTSTTTTTTASQPAQVAAQQAWNRQSPSSAAAGGVDDTSRYGGTSNNNNNGAAAAAAALGGAGLAGGTAAYYGQGKEHDQNPRSDKSEEIADRALGQGNNSSAYTGTGGFQPEHKTSSTMPGTFPSGGLSSSGLNSSRVVHKCQQCGADNDISHYFNKDASFKADS